MKQPTMTFWEAVKISWRKELKLGKLGRILRLAFFTVIYSLVHVFYVLSHTEYRLGK